MSDDDKVERDIRGYLVTHTAELARSPYGWSTDQINALLRQVDTAREAVTREVERRREAEAERDRWNADAQRLAAGLLAIHDAPQSSTVRALCSVAGDIALNCIDAETARFQITRRSAQVERQGGSPDE